MFTIEYKLISGELLLEIFDNEELIGKLLVNWFDSNQQSQVFLKVSLWLQELIEQHYHRNGLDELTQELDLLVDQVFTNLFSRPQNAISEFDRYFVGRVKASLCQMRDAITLYFKSLTTHCDENELFWNAFLVITEAVESIADISFEDNKVQNKLRMQRISNNENPYSEVPDISSDQLVDDAVLQTLNVVNMLNQLTVTQKRRVIKYVFEGYTFQEIADQEGVDYRAVYDSIKAGLDRLRENQ